ncbi:MAG: hypothetical protein GEU81_11055 [Nitriliruptorales bacterium]|nr:hypothetical protein [Nitriliruptorales bacterium]
MSGRGRCSHAIEDVLSQHPKVSEAAVVSAFDDRGASQLHGFVVPLGGVDRGALAPLPASCGATGCVSLPVTRHR